MFVCLMSTGVAEPYVYVFSVDNFEAMIYYLFTSAAYAGDTVIRFLRARRESTRDGVVLVTHLPEIASLYVRTKMFIIDVVSALPLTVICFLSGVSMATSHTGHIVSILRMLRMLKFARVHDMLFRIHEITGWSVTCVNIFQFAVMSMMVLHWIACLWASMGMIEWDGDSYTGTKSWMTKARRSYSFLEFQDDQDLYLMSLYWSVTVLSSVGFGDITPQAKGEFFWAIICMCIGGTVWAYVVGSVCGMAASIDKHRNAFESRLNDINVLCDERRMPPKLREQVTNYYSHAGEFMRMKLYHETIRDLSPALKGEVVNWMYGS